MTNYAAVIDATGISAMTYDQIFAGLQNDYKGVYGADVYLGADSQDGQFLGILALAIKNANDAAIATYNAFSPVGAQGNGLSTIVKINGIRRLTPSFSQCVLTIVGDAGVVINDGIVSDTGTGTQWLLPATVTIPPSGSIIVTATATTAGAILATANTVVNIVNPVPGWQTVTNAVASTPGLPLETDAALRRRQALSVMLPSNTTRESVQANLAALTNVTRVIVFQNDADVVDINGLPPHSIAAVVAGGDALTIAQTISQTKGLASTYGTVSEVVFDAQGVPNTINYSPLQLIPIYFTVTLQALQGYSTSIGSLIVGAIAEYLNELAIGQDVYLEKLNGPGDLKGTQAVVSSGLTQAQLDVMSNTFVIQSIIIGTSQSGQGSANIEMGFNQAAQGIVANGLIVTTT